MSRPRAVLAICMGAAAAFCAALFFCASVQAQLPAVAADNGAAQPWAVMVQFGWAGSWAQDCGSAARPGNWHVDYLGLPSGQATRRMMRGDETRSSRIERVEALGRNRLLVRERYGFGWGEFAGMEKNYVLQFTDDHRRYRSVHSEIGDGREFIEQGRMVATGQESPWVEKCPAR